MTLPVLRAKSQGKDGTPGDTLTEHLRWTVRMAENIRDRVGSIPGMPETFWACVAAAAFLHDCGKVALGFQRMIGNTALPATPWGERHEILSLGFVDLLLSGYTENDRVFIAAAVAGHHRAFDGSIGSIFGLYRDADAEDFAERFGDMNQPQLEQLWDWLIATGREHGLDPAVRICPSPREFTDRAHEMFTRLLSQWDTFSDNGFNAILLLGAVTMADHLSSGHSTLHTYHPLRPWYRGHLVGRLSHIGKTLRPHQVMAADTAGHLLLRSWTGSGKTEAALLWASVQLPDMPGLPRVFYVLPYLASINAMSDRLAVELGTPHGIGVAHSRAASYHLTRAVTAADSDEANLRVAADAALARARATRNFRELFRVGTPYQLLRAALGGPGCSSILVDTANSVFILDELHAYEARRLGMILAMMQLWQRLGGRIAVLSATMPTRLAELVADTLEQPLRPVEPPDTVAAPTRHRIYTRTSHLTDDESIAEILNRLDDSESVLVVANNVQHAINLYEKLAPHCVAVHEPGSALLLHARFTRRDRSRIEQDIRRRFGVGEPRRPGLLVATQVVEVSLDIDFDACHTSAADLEALLQRFGRVNRIGARPEPASVVVHEPEYRRRDQQEWADGVYEEIPTRMALEILRRHEGQAIDERSTTGWLDEIYASEWGDRWRAAVLQERNTFGTDYLSFDDPFADRSHVADRFDEMFNGSEAVLLEHLPEYESAGSRLLADEFLIPLPHWAISMSTYHKKLRVHVIDGDYTHDRGLLAVRGAGHDRYRPGEII